jgi:hypothetical protein
MLRMNNTAAANIAPRKYDASALVALLLYAILALLFFGHPGDWTTRFFGLNGDPAVYVWFIHWWPFAIAHGINPFISYYVWAPHGDNLVWRASSATAALLGLPVTLLGGPILAFNILSMAAPALAAWAAYLLAHHLTGNRLAAFAGGLFYGFSSYETGQMLGHLNLSLNFAVPLVVLVCILRIQQRIGAIAFVAALTALLLIELGLSTEILMTLCVFGAISWAIFLCFAPAADRPAYLRLAFEIGYAACALIIVASPFWYFILIGFSKLPNVIVSPTVYSSDALNFFIPTIVTRIGRTAFAPIAQNFTGNAAEQGPYLGLPLMLLMAVYFLQDSARPYVRALLIVLAFLAIASMGPWLHIGGVATNLWLPWRLVGGLPFVKEALPVRFSMYVSLISAIVVARYLAATGSTRLRRLAFVGLAGVFLVPNRVEYPWSPWPTDKFFTRENIVSTIGAGRTVVILPFGYTGNSMVWQLNSGMAFRQTGGYTGFTPKEEQDSEIVTDFVSGTASPGFANGLEAYCVSHRVDDIIIGQGTPPAIVAAITAMGWPEHAYGDVTVVTVPSEAGFSYYDITGDFWPSAAPRNWMGHQVTIVTHGTPFDLVLAGTGFIPKLVTMKMASKSGDLTFQIGSSMTKTIHLPANAVLTLTADQTFVPASVIHNADQRNLSVMISVEKAK